MKIPGNGRIEAKVRSNQDRRQFLALYLVLRTIIWVSSTQKILFWYTKDTFSGSLDREPVSWFWLADPYFLYRCIPCQTFCITFCCELAWYLITPLLCRMASVLRRSRSICVFNSEANLAKGKNSHHRSESHFALVSAPVFTLSSLSFTWRTSVKISGRRPNG